jgi:bacillithiol biosynthesis cysteine-adding enzyme BshC
MRQGLSLVEPSLVDSECLSFSSIPHSTRLFLDVLTYSGNAPKFYPRSPIIGDWAKSEASRISYPNDRRQAVADILERQNHDFGNNSKTLENLKRFRDGAQVVVTGQQVGLFGGPLFAILKALTAVSLAAKAQKAGVPAVPVFWLATEDHDLAEVNHTFAPTPDGGLMQVATTSSSMEDAPVGDIRFGEEITGPVEQLAELLGSSEIVDALRQAYRPGESMGSAFAKLFASIFRDWGVILIDAYDPELHRIAAPIYQSAIEHAGEIDELLLQRGKELEAAGYHQQVKVTNTSTPLFEIRDGQRTVIQRVNGDFKIGGDRCSKVELLTRIATHPETFSPNVLLRPIAQDYLLPTLAYTGGPAEVAYFAQVAVVYERLLGRVTPVIPRFSATVVDPKQKKFVDKYGLKLTDLFHGEERVRVLMAQNVLPSTIQSDFVAAAASLTQAMDKIRADLQQLDPTLVDAASNAESKMQHQLQQLEARAARAQLQRDEIIERHARLLSTHLFPRKDLQEREIAGVYFMAKYGRELLDTLYEATLHDCTDHQVVYLS